MATHTRCLYQITVFGCVFMYSGVVSIKSAPFIAALQGCACAASVVHERFLLTAASCLVDDFGTPINVTKAIVGTEDLTKGGQLYAIETVFPHTNYSIHTGDYNIALVKLTRNIVLGPNVRPIKLGNRRVEVGDIVSVVGWGWKMKHLTVLHRASVAVLNKDECQQGMLGRIIAPRMLCAGVSGQNRSDCVVNVGGPVFANKSLVAVATPFTGCCRLPGLYTRVSVVRRWILDTIDQNNIY